jgi:XTP/dITP diphosphohydrolase
MTDKIVLASGNAGKLAEIRAMLAGQDLEVCSQADFQTPEVAETGLSFVENALIKARHATRFSGLPALADDSGLEVDALRGAPGVFSARYAGPGASDVDNNLKLLEELASIADPERTARFRCVMVYLRHPEDPSPIIAQGVWEGRILAKTVGAAGFGYDPLFLPSDCERSAAELSGEEKNRLSHRGKALRALIEQFHGV